jgi:hypothetical protein
MDGLGAAPAFRGKIGYPPIGYHGRIANPCKVKDDS